jgi:glycosyltransferase involved in cell wall biosynthesis
MKTTDTETTFQLLFVNSNDKMGQRFSGIDWFEKLEEQGFSSRMLIGRDKYSDDERVQTFRNRTPMLFQNAVKYFERSLGRQSYLSPTYLELSSQEGFKNADLVHYQVIHDGSWFRLEDLPRLSLRKPSIWTWHDAWPITGHCIQPLSCPQFKKQCEICPHLDWPMPLTRDTAKSERLRKTSIIKKSKVNVHVTSNWMANLISDSGNYENLELRIIPFGLDTSLFNPEGREEIRKKYGIAEDSFVIGIRASDWVVKNTQLFIDTIERLKTGDRRVEIFIYEKTDTLWRKSNLPSGIRAHDFGWLDDATLIETYRCLNVFLGISTGESFGFMPLEAAACGAIPISLKGTAVSEFVTKIDPILSIENNVFALKEILERLLTDNLMYLYLQRKTLEVIASSYTLNEYIVKLASFYREVIEGEPNA